MRIRTLSVFVFMIVALALLPLPLVAQDIVAEAPPPPALSWAEIAVIAMMAILAILLVAFASTLVFFSRQLLNAAPPWVAEIIKENASMFKDLANRGITDITNAIPGELDDRLGAIIRDELERVLGELFPEDSITSTPDKQPETPAQFGGPPPPPVG